MKNQHPLHLIIFVATTILFLVGCSVTPPESPTTTVTQTEISDQDTNQAGATLTAITSDKNNQITSIAFSPDNKFIAAATDCGIVSIFGLTESGTIFRLNETTQDTIIQFASAPHMMAFSLDSKSLAISSRGDSLDNTCRRAIPVTRDDEGTVTSPSWTAVTEIRAEPLVGIQNGLWWIREDSITFWGFSSAPLSIPIGYGVIGGANFVVQNDSESALVFQRTDGHSFVWEMDTNEAFRNMNYEELETINATTTFSPDATVKAVANGNNINLKQATDNQVWHMLKEGHQSIVTAIAFSRDGKTLFSASEDGQIIIWDIGTIVSEYFPDPPPKDMPLILHKFFTSPGATSLELSFGDSILAIGYRDLSIGVRYVSELVHR